MFYGWPSAGGQALGFSFRARYAIRALNAPSVLYDYYNPEANATVLPVKVTVR